MKNSIEALFKIASSTKASNRFPGIGSRNGGGRGMRGACGGERQYDGRGPRFLSKEDIEKLKKLQKEIEKKSDLKDKVDFLAHLSEMDKTAAANNAAVNIGKTIRQLKSLEKSPIVQSMGGVSNLGAALLNRFPTKQTVTKIHKLGIDKDFGTTFKQVPYAVAASVKSVQKNLNLIGKKGWSKRIARHGALRSNKNAMKQISESSPALAALGLGGVGVYAATKNNK